MVDILIELDLHYDYDKTLIYFIKVGKVTFNRIWLSTGHLVCVNVLFFQKTTMDQSRYIANKRDLMLGVREYLLEQKFYMYLLPCTSYLSGAE